MTSATSATYPSDAAGRDASRNADGYRSRRPLSASAVKRCPTCRTPLDGGPVRFRCYPCATAVIAADLDTEYHPTHHTTNHADDGAHTGADPYSTAPEGRPTA